MSDHRHGDGEVADVDAPDHDGGEDVVVAAAARQDAGDPGVIERQQLALRLDLAFARLNGLEGAEVIEKLQLHLRRLAGDGAVVIVGPSRGRHEPAPSHDRPAHGGEDELLMALEGIDLAHQARAQVEWKG